MTRAFSGGPIAGSWGHRNPTFSHGTVRPKNFRSCFFCFSDFSKKDGKHVFFRKVQLLRSTSFHFSKVALPTSKKLCLALSLPPLPSLLSRLSFLSRDVLPGNHTARLLAPYTHATRPPHDHTRPQTQCEQLSGLNGKQARDPPKNG